MITKFNMTRDINGYNGFGLPFSNVKYNTILVENVEQTLIVPSTQDATYQNLLAVFSFETGTTVWVARNATASLPGSSFALSNVELNPAARSVKPGDILHFISPDITAQIGVSFYAIT